MSNRLLTPDELTKELAMTFELPEDAADTAAALRAAEPQAPKQMKALLIQAAGEIDDYKRAATDCVQELNAAAALRVSHMDTGSKAEETNRYIRQALASCAARLSALIQKGENHVRRT